MNYIKCVLLFALRGIVHGNIVFELGL